MSRFTEGNLSKGVVEFITGRASITASLPANKQTCQWCRWCKHDYGLDRETCILIPGEDGYLMDYKHCISPNCPVEWQQPKELPDVLF